MRAEKMRTAPMPANWPPGAGRSTDVFGCFIGGAGRGGVKRKKSTKDDTKGVTTGATHHAANNTDTAHTRQHQMNRYLDAPNDEHRKRDEKAEEEEEDRHDPAANAEGGVGQHPRPQRKQARDPPPKAKVEHQEGAKAKDHKDKPKLRTERKKRGKCWAATRSKRPCCDHKITHHKKTGSDNGWENNAREDTDSKNSL